MTQETQVVVFASQKGGSGNTTLSGHNAVQAVLSGAVPVALIDTDPQGSLSKWWNARASETPVFARTTVENLGRDIALLKESGIKLIVIDTPPAVTSAITEVISYADLVVVPTRPSPHDLRAVGVTGDLVDQQGKPLVFVVNCATARARITSETAVSLSQHGTVAPATLHNRVDFAASMIDGRTVGEINPGSRSAKEVVTLWNYIEERLRRLTRSVEKHDTYSGPQFEVELLTPIRSVANEPVEEPIAAAVPPPEPVLPSGDLEPLFDEEPGSAPARLERRVRSALQNQLENSVWDQFDRRSIDVGPPSGLPDRRRSPTFGRRNSKS